MKKSLALILLLSLFLSSCVYYNTFYNARKSFNSAQKKALNAQGKPSSQAVQEYNDVIKKCGKIITYHKNSEWTDDAAYLMAQALYFKQTNNHQALRQFEELVTNFPESEFTPEAKLFIIRINRSIRNFEEANTLIADFVIDPANKDYYNKLHLLAAEFNLEDKEYNKAKYHLERILAEDRKSKEYSQAYFLLGRTYHLNKEYTRSSEIFTELLRLKTTQEMELDTKYYLAYNAFYLGEFQVADKIIKSLLRKENRTQKIPLVKLLKGRILLAEGDTDGFVDAAIFILDNHARTEVSAESAFHLGEYYLYKAFDYAKAIVYYNKVKTEYAKSEFLEASITKSSVASQILLLSDPNRSLDPEALVSEQFKLAEYFINIMSLPDSALVVYDKIIANKDLLVSQLDTLNTALETERINFEATQDSLESAHTQAIVADTLRIDMIEAIADSLIVEDTQSDSTSQNYLRTAYEKSAQYREIKNKIDSVNRILNEYDVKILPFTHFVKAWIYKNLKDSSESAELIYTTLSQNFPHNEYTYACSLMLAGEQPDLMTPMQRINQSNYDTAIDIMESNPDSALVLIKSFTDDKGSEFYLNSLYTTGYINYFVKGDTLAARPWFDKLLEEDAKDKYRVNVSTFYQNGLFLTTEIVNENEGTDNDLREESLSHPDSLMKSTVIDSLDFPKAIPADEFFPE